MYKFFISAFFIFLTVFIISCPTPVTDNNENTISVDGISLNEENITLLQGGEEQLTAIITPNNASNKNVKWVSSNEDIATVTQDGTVKIIGSGKTLVTVSTSDGNKSASCIVMTPLTSLSEIANYLDQETEGLSSSAPIFLPVAIDLGTMINLDSGWQKLINIINKFVYLDLTFCNMNLDKVFNPVHDLSSNKNRIVSILLPDAANSIQDGASNTAAFQYFDNLEFISGTNIEYIGMSSLDSRTKLKEVDLPNVKNIGRNAFTNCTGITEVNFPLATYIGVSAFLNCTNLATIILKSAETLESYAVMGCSRENLTIILGNVAPLLGSYMFKDDPVKTVTVQIPPDAVGYEYFSNEPPYIHSGSGNRSVPNWLDGFRGWGWRQYADRKSYIVGTDYEPIFRITINLQYTS